MSQFYHQYNDFSNKLRGRYAIVFVKETYKACFVTLHNEARISGSNGRTRIFLACSKRQNNLVITVVSINQHHCWIRGWGVQYNLLMSVVMTRQTKVVSILSNLLNEIIFPWKTSKAWKHFENWKDRLVAFNFDEFWRIGLLKNRAFRLSIQFGNPWLRMEEHWWV